MSNAAVLLFAVGCICWGAAAIAGVAEWLDRRDERRDRVAARRARRQQAWREANMLNFDWEVV